MICKQVYSKESRASACKHLPWCKACDIQATSERLQAMYSSQVISWALKQQRFDATLGYPGEGPPCKTCPQFHRTQAKADNCKHKQWCKECNQCFPKLRPHMIQIHKGWTCAKKCNKKHARKQTAIACTCKLCEFCHKYVHNRRQHNQTVHNRLGDTRVEQVRNAKEKHRQSQTPEQRVQSYETNNKQRKLTRDAGKSQEKNFECPKCSHPFVYPGHIKRCACKKCKICNQHTRDLTNHTKHEHPEHYVKEKLDLYKSLREDC